MVKKIKNIVLGDRSDVGGGNAGQINFLGRRIVGHALPALHHIAEEAAEVQVVPVDGARGAQLYKIEVMQVVNHVIRNVQVRRMALRVDHINITAHGSPQLNILICRSTRKRCFCFFIVAQQATPRQFHQLIRNAKSCSYYKTLIIRICVHNHANAAFRCGRGRPRQDFSE